MNQMTTRDTSITVTVTPTLLQHQPVVSRILAIAETFREIDCPEMEQAAADEYRIANKYDKDLEAERKSFTDPFDQAKKRLMDTYRPLHEALGQAKEIIKGGMHRYQAKVEAERRRVEAEMQERARKEQARLQKQAEAAAAKGKVEVAEALQAKAETVQAPVLAKRAAPAGVSSFTTWSAEVTDKMALIKAVAAGQASEALLEVNMTVANKLATAMKEAFLIPGLAAKSKKGMRG